MRYLRTLPRARTGRPPPSCLWRLGTRAMACYRGRPRGRRALPMSGGPMVNVTPLVSTQWLATQLNDPQLRVIDIRSVVDGGARAAHEQAHVPGAIHTDYAKDGWRATSGMATGLLPEAGALARLIGRLGVRPEHHVV